MFNVLLNVKTYYEQVMHILLRLYACDFSLDVTLVLIILNMIPSKYQLVSMSSSFPQQNDFHQKMMINMTKRH